MKTAEECFRLLSYNSTDHKLNTHRMQAVEQIQLDAFKAGAKWAAEASLKIPRILFDGYAVLQAIPEAHRKRTSAENVCDVLDAVVSILRKST